jgi:hypothetical protein
MGRIIIDKKTYRFSNIEVAGLLGVHRLTIANALNQGETHPLYKKIIHTITQKNKTQ